MHAELESAAKEGSVYRSPVLGGERLGRFQEDASFFCRLCRMCIAAKSTHKGIHNDIKQHASSTKHTIAFLVIADSREKRIGTCEKTHIEA